MHPDDRVPDEPFTWPEARARGLTRKRLATYVREGHVRRVLRNVYVAAGVDDSLETRVAAASKVTSAWAVICDRTAAWLWGVDTFEFRELEILPPVESFVLRGHTRTRRLGVAGGVRDLASRDLVEIGGVTVTSPLRTALDLACTLGRRDALAALDGFMRLHGITREQMHRELRRYRGRRGVVQARELVQYADPRAESPGESWTRMTMIDRDLPVPEPQWWVRVDGVPTYRLDLAYPKHKVAIEFDGREFHEGDVRRKADRARRKWLHDHGWIVVVVTQHDFTPARIEEWTYEVRDALRIAA